MARKKIIYYPDLSVQENAERNHCTPDNIRYYLKKHGIDRRNANKEKIIQAIKDYLKDNPDAKISQVAKATNITEMTIRKYWDAARGNESSIEIGKRKLPKTNLNKLNLSASVFRDILRIEDFELDVLEPFIGKPVADEIKKQGHNPIYPEGGLFVVEQKKKNDIVSMPPYINEDVVNHCFSVFRKKMALLLPVGCLTDINTHQSLFKAHIPIKIHVYPDKPYMWVVWERGFKGNTEIDWVAQRGKKTKNAKTDAHRQTALKDEEYEETILDGVKFKLYKFFDYRLQDIVQFHSQAYKENQMMSNHYNCIVKFRGVEFYGFEMLFHSMKFAEHPEILKEVMSAPSARRAKKISMQHRNLYFDGSFKEKWFRVYVLSQLFKYLSVKEYRDRLRELRGQTLVECPNGHGTSAEATQDLDTNIFHGRNYSGRFTMLIRDMMLPLEDAAIEKKEADLGRKLTDAERDEVVLGVCNEVREKYENLPQVKADTDTVINYIKDPQNGISLTRKKLKPYTKPVIDWLSKAIIVDFDGCLFDTSVDDAVRKRKRKRGEKELDIETGVFPLIPQYKLYDGWRDLLSWAKENKVKIGVLCNASGKLVEKTMQHFKLPYDMVVGYQPYIDYPNPIRGNMMLNKLKIREKQVLYIGTTKDAEKQARCNQFKFVGGTWGANEVGDLNVPLIDNPKDAIGIVREKLRIGQNETFEQSVKQTSKKDRVYGIIGAVIGDMAGSRFEFREKELPNDKNRFSLICNNSLFTDDSVLTIAIADALLHDKPFADAIGDWGKRFMASGFSKRFIKWVKKGDWSVQDESTCDGCGMRISPIGFKGNSIEEVLEMAKNATIPTHNSEESIKAAQAIATSVFLARNGKSKEDIKQYVETHFNYNLDLTHDDIRKMVIADDPQDQKTKNRKMVEAKNAIPMAIIAFLNGNEYEDVLRTAIMYGGDTDTTCSMAGAIAAAYYGVPVDLTEKAATNIPQEMLNIINEFDGTSLSIQRTTPSIVKNWSLDYVIVYGSDIEDKDGERGFSYTHPSRHQPKPLKGFPIRTIGTTMDVIRKDVERLIAKVNNEPQTTFVIENVGISKKTNIGVETMAQLFKPLIDKENVYFVKEYWDFFNSIS